MMRKCEVTVLFAMCGLALLSAGALRRGGSLRVKTLMCTVNMQKVGQAMAAYWGLYDGKMPNMWMNGNGSTWVAGNCIHSHDLFSQYNGYGVQPPQIWVQFGCIYNVGLVPDGRTFYCPATEGSTDEYKSYGSYSPWGVLPQPINPVPPSQNQYVRLKTGFAYWPQASAMVTGTSTLYGLDGVPLTGNGWDRYRAGLPAPALKASDVDVTRPMAVDNGSQPDGFGGYKVNTLYADGHANYQPVPKYNGKWICPYGGRRPTGVVADEWYSDGTSLDNGTMMSNYMYLLQP